MTPFPSIVQSSLGRTFHLAKQIGKGGEGAIYETSEQQDIAVKLYWPDKAQSRREKIAAMASAQWYKTSSFVAFPIDILFSPNGAFVGFVMKKIGGSKPVHMLFTPASRKAEFSRANYRFLIRAAGNIARAVASVHSLGCVIGDVNHSGFLVSDKAVSILIDSDSFQVVASNHKYLCQVGTPDYTPPELQGVRFDRVPRTPNHDNFGLAVLVFQILFMGRHPFSGRYQGSGDMPLERAIGEFRFAYSAQASRTQMLPPPGAPLLTDFPPHLGAAFENAFGQQGRSLRSTAAEWISLLENLETYLVPCSAEPSHQHIKDKPCPWCRMEQSSPGFVTFNTFTTATAIPIHVDVSQIAALINAIRDPGPTPTIQTVIIVPTNVGPAPLASGLNTNLKRRAYLGVGASASGAILISFGGIAIVPGLLVLGAGVLANAFPPKELKKLREARSQAETSWRSIEDAWSKQPGNTKFLQIKSEVNEYVRLLSDLPNEEKRELQKLEQNKKDAQLRRHLDRYLIANAKIKKIGAGRKAVLASFGVQTAADIQQQRISAIQGFGPALVSSLMAWRQGAANRFVFNASEPVNQVDLANMKARIANRKADLDTKIRSLAGNLQQASNFSLAQRAKISSLANQAFAARRQAEINEQSATGPLHKASKVISLCCIGLAAIGLVISNNSTTSAPPHPSSVVVTKAPDQPPPRPEPPIAVSKYVPPVIVPPQRGGGAPPVGSSSSTPLPPSNPPRQEESALPSLPGPQEVPQLPIPNSVVPAEPVLKRQLSKTEDVIQIQKKLFDLGYMSVPANGKWGPLSKRALGQYKQQAGLEKNDLWDATAEDSLFGENAPRAIRTLAFIGGWTNELGQCGGPGEAAPLRIMADRAETDGGACQFNSVSSDGNNAWRIDATCSSGGTSHAAHIRLAINGSVLHWTSEQPENIYYRCENFR
jgi:DNA-binding helix-hairpin-helix protein with protein kinase domain